MDYKTIMRENGFKSLNQAQSFLRLTRDDDVRDSFSMLEMKKAILETTSFDKAKRYLKCYCALCRTHNSKDKMELFPLCNCEVCIECFNNWIRHCVNEETVNIWYCPVCEGQKKSISKLQQHLSFLQRIVENRPELYDIRKSICREIAGWTMKVTHKWFRWCENPECTNGYVWELTSPKMKCPSCQGHTCRDCHKQWLPEHDGKTCEEFQAILLQRDPALAELLSVSFACPKCNYIFMLESGGCMHIDCEKCKMMFCLGCLQEYFVDNKCNQSNDCRMMGFHAHHPRNCPFYSRDMAPEKLQQLLKSMNVTYEEEEQFVSCLCTLSDDQIVSRGCGKVNSSDYTEYLGGLVAENGIDPIEIMEVDDLLTVCKRERINLPSTQWTKTKLVKILQSKNPVKRLKYVFTQLIKKELRKQSK